MNQNRRSFLKNSLAFSAGVALSSFHYPLFGSKTNANSDFKISLAQWSFNNTLFDNEFSNLDFPVKAKELGIDAVEYVNSFFENAGEKYLRRLLNVTNDNGVNNLLIMVDGEGNLGDTDSKARKQSIENHYKWIDAAKFLGCHSIRVNARGEGTAKEVADAAVDGLGRLTEYGKKSEINVIVENHGGYSSNGQWLADVISRVNSPHCGTLPDFGNFCIEFENTNGNRKCVEEYNRYKGVKELMPYAKGVSAKSYDFDEDGYETTIDYEKMIRIVQKSGYKGYIGIEYEGRRLSEKDGILATKRLLEKVFQKL